MRRLLWGSALALVSLLASVSAAQAYIYWTTSDELNSRVGRAELNGGAANHSFITGAQHSAGVASNGTYVFWGNAAPGRVGRANVNGTGVNQSFLADGCGAFAQAANATHV